METRTSPADPIRSFAIFNEGLENTLRAKPEVRDQFERAIAISAAAALSARGLGAPGEAEMQRLLREGFPAPRGGTVCRAFFWGFHIQISHEDLEAFLSGAVPVNELVGRIGGSIPSPAAPWIALAAVFVAGALALLRSLDRGNGVYVSMSWFAPGIFVPTSV